MTHPKLATAKSGYGGRGYYIPGDLHPLDGSKIIYPSVTTILKQVAKESLHQWIADQTAAAAVANLGLLQQWKEESMYAFLQYVWTQSPEKLAGQVRTNYLAVRDDAAEIGTGAHEWLELWLEGLGGEAPLEGMRREVQQIIEVLVQWAEQHQITVHRSEFTVLNRELGYAGTGDADWSVACLHGGPPCMPGMDQETLRIMLDLKTSRGSWRDHGMQVAALACANVWMREVAKGHPRARMHEATVGGEKVRSWWIEEEAPRFDRVGLLHVRPYDLTAKGEVIEPFAKVKDRTRLLPTYMKGFEGALALAKMDRELKLLGHDEKED